MTAFYPEIRLLHVVAVIASGSLFLLRGLAINARAWQAAGLGTGIRRGGPRWAMAAPLRYLSYGIDTVLLASAVALVTIVQAYPFVHAWLTAKLLLLLVYILLGHLALKRGRTPFVRRSAFVAALLVFALIVGVARAHHPLGFLEGLAGT
ncbi:MAG: SirB2 family protein [Sneathiellaceae bacterium]